jgi:hypothetical protein
MTFEFLLSRANEETGTTEDDEGGASLSPFTSVLDTSKAVEGVGAAT